MRGEARRRFDGVDGVAGEPGNSYKYKGIPKIPLPYSVPPRLPLILPAGLCGNPCFTLCQRPGTQRLLNKIEGKERGMSERKKKHRLN